VPQLTYQEKILISCVKENFNVFRKKTIKFPNSNKKSPGLFSWFQSRISWSTPGFFLMNSWFSKFGFGSPEENARKISFRLGKTENFP